MGYMVFLENHLDSFFPAIKMTANKYEKIHKEIQKALVKVLEQEKMKANYLNSLTNFHWSTNSLTITLTSLNSKMSTKIFPTLLPLISFTLLLKNLVTNKSLL